MHVTMLLDAMLLSAKFICYSNPFLTYCTVNALRM